MKLAMLLLETACVGLVGLGRGIAVAAKTIPVGQPVAQTDAVALVAHGVADAVTFFNNHSGTAGKRIDIVPVDYDYDPAHAISAHKEWKDSQKPLVIQGWGTTYTEAVVDGVSQDGLVFTSGLSSGHLTHSTRRLPWTNAPASYSFFHNLPCSDGYCTLVPFAVAPWKKTGNAARGAAFLGDLYRPEVVDVRDNGVCLALMRTPADHRGTTTVMLYRNDYNDGTVSARRVYKTRIPLRPDRIC